jgi:hypothetical protein
MFSAALVYHNVLYDAQFAKRGGASGLDPIAGNAEQHR